MAAPPRYTATKDIVDRKRQSDGSIMRELACGHFQKEPSGGKAKEATIAKCKTCNPPKEKR